MQMSTPVEVAAAAPQMMINSGGSQSAAAPQSAAVDEPQWAALLAALCGAGVGDKVQEAASTLRDASQSQFKDAQSKASVDPAMLLILQANQSSKGAHPRSDSICRALSSMHGTGATSTRASKSGEAASNSESDSLKTKVANKCTNGSLLTFDPAAQALQPVLTASQTLAPPQPLNVATPVMNAMPHATSENSREIALKSAATPLASRWNQALEVHPASAEGMTPEGPSVVNPAGTAPPDKLSDGQTIKSPPSSSISDATELKPANPAIPQQQSVTTQRRELAEPLSPVEMVKDAPVYSSVESNRSSLSTAVPRSTRSSTQDGISPSQREASLQPISLAHPTVTGAQAEHRFQIHQNESTSGRVDSSSLAERDTFSVLDGSISPPRTSWIHANANHAEAGYLDPSLGWVNVRADIHGTAVHASVVPGSSEAASSLSGHMADLNQYLADHKSPATVTLSSAASDRSLMGNSSGNQSGYREQQQQQDAPAVFSSQIPGRSSAHTQTSPNPHFNAPIAATLYNTGANISVVA